MSVLGKEISSVGGSGRDCVDGDGDEDDDENGGVNGRCRCRGKDENSKKQRGISGIGFSRNLGKAKQVVLSPFTKVKKQLPRRNNNTRAAASSSCSLFSSGKRFGDTGGNKGCYFCFTQPLTVESSAESQTSDPNSPNFTYGKLRSFIEMNDFYSKECNHHVNYVPT